MTALRLVAAQVLVGKHYPPLLPLPQILTLLQQIALLDNVLVSDE